MNINVGYLPKLLNDYMSTNDKNWKAIVLL